MSREIQKICKNYGIKNYIINDDFTIDVNGEVNLYKKGLTKLPLKFRKVSGNFLCSNNELTSLKGAPKLVGGNFYCHNNNLTTLYGCPQHIVGDFICNNNNLTTLDGCPEWVGGIFDYKDNILIYKKIIRDENELKIT